MKQEELSINCNVKALYDALGTREDLIELVTEPAVATLLKLYDQLPFPVRPIYRDDILHGDFKIFVIGYLLGMNDGELAGRMKALRDSEQIVRDTFAALAEGVGDEPDSTEGRD